MGPIGGEETEGASGDAWAIMETILISIPK
jgi:hypothetical protein